jgi:glycosyltransferase involved in cell wall biosynthesis
VISNALRDLLLKKIPEARDLEIVVAHDGVDIERFQHLDDTETAKRKANRDFTRPVAGYAGHLYAGRGIEIILACAKALPDWDFVIAGGTPEDVRAYTNQATQLKLTNIEFWGFIPNSALAEKLSIADVLLMPYQKSVSVSSGALDTVQWMSPLKMFEYMAMGRAIISSDLPVLREVLNEKTATLVDPTDPTAWTEALHSLRTIEARRPLIEAALKSVDQYTWRKRAESIMDKNPGIRT